MKRKLFPRWAFLAVICGIAFRLITLSAFAQYSPQYFTSVGERDKWVARIRELIEEGERELKKDEATLERYERHYSKYPDNRAGQRDDVNNWTQIVSNDKKKLAKLRALHENIPPVRDMEAERREQQRIADERAASQRQAQEQRVERARQSQAATARQSKKAERAEGVANALMQSFNNKQESDRAWAVYKKRKERENNEFWNQVGNGRQETDADKAKTFGREVVKETGSILAGQLWQQAKDGDSFSVRNAARGGIDNLVENTFNSIVDDTVDSVKDAAYNTVMSLAPQDRQMDIRALQMPLSFLSLRWGDRTDAYVGPNSAFQKDFVDPFNRTSSYLWEE